MNSGRFGKMVARGLSLVLILTNGFCAYASESNLWEQRRQTRAPFSSLPTNRTRVLTAGAHEPDVFFRTPTLSRSATQTAPDGFVKAHTALFSALPPSSGSLRRISVPAKPAPRHPLVIHIQDVHMNGEAQWNIREIVSSLIQSGQVDVVALEGAFGPIPIEPFRDYPHQESLQKVADYLLRERRISGPVHAGLSQAPQAPLFVGIDDHLHYQANVEAYRASAPQRTEEKKRLAVLEKKLAQKKKTTFNPTLAVFDGGVHAYRSGKISFGDYLQFLVQNEIPPPPQVSLYLKTLAQEKGLDFVRVEKERGELLEELTKGLGKEDVSQLLFACDAYRKGRITPPSFYFSLRDICIRKGVSLRSFPTMNAYFDYLLSVDRIDGSQLFESVKAMEDFGYTALAKTDQEKCLVSESRKINLSEKLLDFSLTPEEWREYKTFYKNQETRTSFETFFQEAEFRDRAMATHLLAVMENHKAKVSVLVTGGFHAPGIEKILRQNGVAVLTFVPKLTKLDFSDGAASLSFFTQAKTPLEKMVEGQRLFVSPPPFSLTSQMEAALALKVMDGDPNADTLLRETTSGFAQHIETHEETVGNKKRVVLKYFKESDHKGQTPTTAVRLWVDRTPTGIQAIQTELVKGNSPFLSPLERRNFSWLKRFRPPFNRMDEDPTLQRRPVGALRRDPKLYDPIYGERMFQSVPHRVSVAVIATSLPRLVHTLEAIDRETSMWPPHHQLTRVRVGVLGDETLASDIRDLGLPIEVIVAGDVPELVRRLRDSAYDEDGATLMSILSDQCDREPGDLSRSLHELFYYRKPVMLATAAMGPRKGHRPSIRDLTFFTDAHFIRSQEDAGNALERAAPYFVVHVVPHAQPLADKTLFDSDELWTSVPIELRGDRPISGEDGLPVSSSVMVFEPHPDDLALAATHLTKRLLEKNNRIQVVGLFCQNTRGWWPLFETARVQENGTAFRRLWENAFSLNARPPPLLYLPLTFQPRAVGWREAKSEAVARLVKRMAETPPDVLIVPASADTHRDHVRLREVAMAAAQIFANETGRTVKILSIPLFSAERPAFTRGSHLLFPTLEDESQKQKVLESYVSQQEYVQGPGYASFRNRQSHPFHVDPRDGRAPESFSSEAITPVVRNPEDTHDLVTFAVPDSLRLRGKSDFLIIRWAPADVGRELDVFLEGHPSRAPPREAIDGVLNDLYREILHRDSAHRRLERRVLFLAGKEVDPLVWLIDSFRHGYRLDSFSEKDNENLVIALKVLFERLAGRSEDLKLSEGRLASVPLRDPALVQKRERERQKLVIGIPSHNSDPIIAQRFSNLAEEIRQLPEAWAHWEIEIVVCINGKPEDLDPMANRTILQIPHGVFNGIKNPLRLVFIKSPIPNATLAINALHAYAQQAHATMVLSTDDDVHFYDQTLTRSLRALISLPAHSVVGTRFFWRRRSTEDLRDEIVHSLQRKGVSQGLLPWRASFELIGRRIWQEIAIFRRRPDIPFSPKELMGAGILRWADDFNPIPYWFPQSDIWVRYRSAPNAVIVDNARMSSVAAQTLRYYLAKRARSFYGFKDDINIIFSASRRHAQNDGDVHYRERIDLKTIAWVDVLWLGLSLFVFAMSEWLYRHFAWYYQNPRFAWDMSERGAESRPISADEALVSPRFLSDLGSWDTLEIEEGSVWVIKKEGGKVVFQRKPLVLDTPVPPLSWPTAFRSVIEKCPVDGRGYPTLTPTEIHRLCTTYRSGENPEVSDTFLENVMMVFSILYAVPDEPTRDIQERLGLDQESILKIFDFIRSQEALQRTFLDHPTQREYFQRMSGLLASPQRLDRILDGINPFPLDMEIHPSIACNSRCEFCYSKGHMFYDEHRAGQKPLDLAEWVRLIDEAADRGLRRLDVAGGLEPLMPKSLTLPIIREAKKRGLQVRLFTNGIAINPNDQDQIDTLLSVDQVFVSVRGATPWTYAKTTQTSEADYHRAMAGIRLLLGERRARSLPVKIGIAFFVSKSNYSELAEVVDKGYAMGVDAVGLGSDNTKEELEYGGAERDSITQQLSYLLHGAALGRYQGMVLSLSPALLALHASAQGNLPPIYNYRLRTTQRCQMWNIKPVVNPYGAVFPCCAHAQPVRPAHGLGFIGANTSLGALLKRHRNTEIDPHSCSYCSPAEHNNLSAMEKLAIDQRGGLPISRQPYRPYYPGPSATVQENPQRPDLSSLTLLTKEFNVLPQSSATKAPSPLLWVQVLAGGLILGFTVGDGATSVLLVALYAFGHELFGHGIGAFLSETKPQFFPRFNGHGMGLWRTSTYGMRLHHNVVFLSAISHVALSAFLFIPTVVSWPILLSSTLIMTIVSFIPWQRMFEKVGVTVARSDMDVAIDHELAVQLSLLLAGSNLTMDVAQTEQLISRVSTRIDNDEFLAEFMDRLSEEDIDLSGENRMKRLLEVRGRASLPLREAVEKSLSPNLKTSVGLVFLMDETMKDRWDEIESALRSSLGTPAILVAENAATHKYIQERTNGSGHFILLNGETAVRTEGGVTRLSLKTLEDLLLSDKRVKNRDIRSTSLTLAAPKKLILDFGGLPNGSIFLNKNTVILFLDALLSVTPVGAIQLRKMDRIVQAWSKSA